MRRIAAAALFLVGLALSAFAPAINARPMDLLSAGWFILTAATAAVTSCMIAYTLVQHLRAGEFKRTLDGLFWGAFIVLPFALWVLASSLFALGTYVTGME